MTWALSPAFGPSEIEITFARETFALFTCGTAVELLVARVSPVNVVAVTPVYVISSASIMKYPLVGQPDVDVTVAVVAAAVSVAVNRVACPPVTWYVA